MLPELNRDCVKVYARVIRSPRSTTGHLVAHSDLPEATVRACLDTLAALRLVATGDGRWSAVDPQAAACELLDPVEEDLRRRQQALEEDVQRTRDLRRSIADLGPLYRTGTGRALSGHHVEVLTGADTIRAALASAMHEAHDEVLTIQPGSVHQHETLQDGARRDRAALARGLRLKCLYHHTARTSLALRAYVDRVHPLGAEVRTARELFARMMIFDRGMAFLSDVPDPSDVPGDCGQDDAAYAALRLVAGEAESEIAADASDTPRVIVVRDTSVIRHLRGLYHVMWRFASPILPEERGYGEVAGEMHRMVAQLLAQGLKDETAARELGVSVRSFRRHVAALSVGLQAESRFQAGVAAARVGLLHD